MNQIRNIITSAQVAITSVDELKKSESTDKADAYPLSVSSYPQSVSMTDAQSTAEIDARSAALTKQIDQLNGLKAQLQSLGFSEDSFKKLIDQNLTNGPPTPLTNEQNQFLFLETRSPQTIVRFIPPSQLTSIVSKLEKNQPLSPQEKILLDKAFQEATRNHKLPGSFPNELSGMPNLQAFQNQILGRADSLIRQVFSLIRSIE